MKPPILYVLSSLLCVGLSAAEPDPTDGTSVGSRITDVTVYADRAQVTRAGKVSLSEGASQYVMAKLPGWIDEGSIRLALSPADAGQIVDVQVIRTYLGRGDDDEFRKAELSVREIADQVAALDDDKAALEAQAKQIDSIRMFSMDKLPKDAASREVKVEEYGQSVEFVAASLRKIAAEKRELDKKRRDLEPMMEVRQRKLNELRQRTQLEERTVVVSVAATSAREATLSLKYMLPGATWEPVHELRASGVGKSVALGSYAVVMQTTGEDWNGVNLTLSSQRSTATMRIPELESFLVGSGHKLPKFSSGGRDTFSEANVNWAAQNALLFDAKNADARRQQEFRKNQAVQLDNTRRAVQAFEHLNERGTTTHFATSGTQIVRSDGRPVRIPIGQADLEVSRRIIAAPEASLNAARVVDLVNGAKQPILPGRVALYLDGAFLGMTEMEFVAPGESFSLFLGVADEIKLSRILDRKKSELIRSGSKTRMKISYVMKVENLSSANVSLQLSDRVPVSDTDEIRVSSIKTTPTMKPDSKGLVHWELDVNPRQSLEFRIEYTLEYPTTWADEGPLDAAKMKMQSAPVSVPTSNAAPLRRQIETLERNF